MLERNRWLGLIGGEPHESSTGEMFTVYEPSTGTALAEVAAFGPEDVDLAVAAARTAFEDWRWLTPKQRGQWLQKVAATLREHATELAELETREMGKPLEQSSRFDVPFAADVCEYFGGMADKLAGDSFQIGPVSTYTVPEPYGVIGAIIPFNWPPIHTAGKVAPALAAGNTLVIKPGEQAPLTCIRIIELMSEVLPPGVVNVTPGLGAAGAALVGHPGVGKVSFTGSNHTARAVVRGAADNLTPSLLELGGKNPFLVFPDADLDSAVAGAIEGMFFNQGEACTAASRILLHTSIHDEFLARFCPAVEKLRLGDGLDPATQLGPMVSAEQKDRVLSYIQVGKDEGAKVVAEGQLPDDPRLSDGYFVAPLVFDEVKSSMRIAQEEIFGPVATILTFEDEDEAVHIANDTPFGLVAGVYTGDIARANRVARRLEAGMVFINNFNRGFLGTPFGGVKESGHGREHGLETILEFVTTKTVRMPSGIGEIPRWSGVQQL